jgi:hypothetical protein
MTPHSVWGPGLERSPGFTVGRGHPDKRRVEGLYLPHTAFSGEDCCQGYILHVSFSRTLAAGNKAPRNVRDGLTRRSDLSSRTQGLPASSAVPVSRFPAGVFSLRTGF